MIRSVFINGFIIIHSITFCLWGLTLGLFDSTGRMIHRYAAVPWAKAILRASGVKLRVTGVENVESNVPGIYMSNHQSYFDIFALLAGIPVDFKFILKQELMKIPFLGPAMKQARYISINRRDTRKALKSMNEAAEKIRNGVSVLIFPEGTRSDDGRVRSFKKGGFHLALKSGCDITPVSIINSRKIVPKGSLRVGKGTIDIAIGCPIPMKNYRKRDMERLICDTRDTIIRQMTHKDGSEI